MTKQWWRTALGAGSVMMVAGLVGCDGVTLDDAADIVDIIDNGNDNSVIDDIVDVIDGGNDNGNDNSEADATSSVSLSVFATNTGGATGIAWHPLENALYAVNGEGLYGPIMEDDDVLSDTPLVGATNLAGDDIFDQATASLVLGISELGEFWIGGNCCQTMAVVAPEGGNAEPYLGLTGGFNPVEVKPDTLTFIPATFTGGEFSPGDLLIGEETSFSRLGSIDVDRSDGDRSAINVVNPSEVLREANHLAFGLDGVLYAATGLPTLNETGIQTIDTTGAPTPLAGTESIGVEALVALENGDLVIRGSIQDTGAISRAGILRYSANDQSIEFALELAEDDRSGDDQMIIVDGPDGPTIFLSLPMRNEIVKIIINAAE